MNSNPPASSPATHPSPDDEIRQLAYFKWLDRGCPDGAAWIHWFEAEQEIMASHMKPTKTSDGKMAPHYSIGTTIATHLSDPTHRFHGPGKSHDARTEINASGAPQRVRGRRFGGSLQSTPKQSQSRP